MLVIRETPMKAMGEIQRHVCEARLVRHFLRL
jgi:hypothetical protein